MLRPALIALRKFRRPSLGNVLTALTVLVTAGFVTVFVAMRAQLNAYRSAVEKDAQVMVTSRFARAPLSQAHTRGLDKLPGVGGVVASRLLHTSTPDEQHRFLVSGLLGDVFNITHPQYYFETTPEMQQAWLKERTAAIASRTVADWMGWKVGNQAVISTAIGEIVANLVGISEQGTAEPQVLLHWDYVDELSGKTSEVSLLIVKAENQEAVPKVAAAIEEHLKLSPDPVLAIPELAHAQMLSMDSRAIIGLMNLMGVVFVLLTALVTGNAVRLSVTERRGELATLRAIGYSSRTIMFIVILEALVICMTGAVLGASLMPLLVGRTQFGGFWLSDVPVSAAHAAIGVLFGVAVALASALGPAIYAGRSDVAGAMRGA